LAFGDETSRTTVSATRKATLEKATLANEVEKVEIPVGDLTLRGHLYKPEQSQKLRQTVIIFPGSGAPAEDSAWFIARRYQRIGVQALVINYRGFGESDGRPSEKGFYEDARAICNYATDELGVPHNELWLHGYSIGAPVGAHLAGYLNELGKDIGGIVLDRPMPSTSKGGCRAWFTQSSRPSCKVGNREHECQQ
jgi:RTX toxin RtxA